MVIVAEPKLHQIADHIGHEYRGKAALDALGCHWDISHSHG